MEIKEEREIFFSGKEKEQRETTSCFEKFKTIVFSNGKNIRYIAVNNGLMWYSVIGITNIFL